MFVGAAIGRPLGCNFASQCYKEDWEYGITKRKRIRLENYDYSMPGAYFLTICTRERKNLFWRAGNTAYTTPRDVLLSHYGVFAEESVRGISNRYPMITVDHYVIMPNHIHLLLQIHTGEDGRPMAAPTVTTVVNQMKGYVSKKCGIGIWQKGFYDHVVRNTDDYREIWLYIEGNPGKWLEDKFYTP